MNSLRNTWIEGLRTLTQAGRNADVARTSLHQTRMQREACGESLDWGRLGVLAIAAMAGWMEVAAANLDMEGRDVGDPGLAGRFEAKAGGWSMLAGGTDWGGNRDQGHFALAPWEGDFDVRVRVVEQEATDIWAKAGLVARESWEAGSRSVAALCTPTLAGSYLQVRLSEGGVSSASGAFPANHPNQWLRLQRRGEAFTGFGSVDGLHWQRLASANLSLSNTLWLGLGASSHRSNQVARVEFESFGDVVEAAVLEGPLRREPLGPSTRRTGLVLTEIMYRPWGDRPGLQFIELFNSNPYVEDLSGYRIAGSVAYTFPGGTVLEGGSFLVVGADPAALGAAGEFKGALGPWQGTLPTEGRVELRNDQGGILLEVDYANRWPWPVAADGTGHSLVLARPSHGEREARSWEHSRVRGGSPGRLDAIPAGAWEDVLINEVMAGWPGGVTGFVELYYHGKGSADISGCWLSDRPGEGGYAFPAGSVIPAGGHLDVDQGRLPFTIPRDGGRLFLSVPTQERVIMALDVPAQPTRSSYGQYPEGSGRYGTMSEVTARAANAPRRMSPVVVSEIMFHPVEGGADLEFVEFHNRGGADVDVGGWRLEGGIRYEFPPRTMMRAGSFLVLARNAAQLRQAHPHLVVGDVVGEYQGRLSNGGERVSLLRPEFRPAAAGVSAHTVMVAADEVVHGDKSRWSRWADGGGSSLERVDEGAPGDWSSNWRDSVEDSKSDWTTVEATGVLDHGSGAVDQLQVMLLEAGECLVDNVEVWVEGIATNLVSNGGFESGLTGWTSLGDHVKTSLEPGGGVNGSSCLHVRANNQGEPLANHVRVTLRQTSLLTQGKTVTLRAQVRWLKGHPEVLLRLKGNYLEAFGRLRVPKGLGSPGRPNSSTGATSGLRLGRVEHFPVLPQTNEAVSVTVEVDTSQAKSPRVTLHYRVDPRTEVAAVEMVDSGERGDYVGGDGVYTAMIPSPGVAGLVAFHVEAAGSDAGEGAVTRFPVGAPQQECLVRFGESIPASSFGTYRLWFSASAIKSWISRPVLSNDEVEGTFVYGNHRVVHGIGARYSGSPWHQSSYSSPIAGQTTYAFSLPGDDRVLGSDSFNKLHALGNTPGDDGTLQAEQTAYWMVRQMGLPWNYQRYVLTFVNGVRRGQLMEDTQVPARDGLRQWFPEGSEGDLYKLNGWYEPQSSGGQSFQLISWCTLGEYRTSGGQLKTARYRWNWAPRAVEDTANSYSNIFALVTAANGREPAYRGNLELLADMKQWLRTFAIEHAVGNWDSFGNRNAQNMYAFKPVDGRWKMLIWDFNIVLGNSGSDGPANDNLFQYNSSDSGMGRIYQEPAFQRQYLQQLREVALGPMASGRADQILDNRYAAFRASGITASSPSGLKSWINSRRRFLMNYLTNFQVGFEVFYPTNASSEVAQNWVELAGVAPLEMATLKINGVTMNPQWTNLLVWQVKVPLTSGTNELWVEALDSSGRLLTNGMAQFEVISASPAPGQEGRVVIHEIMHHPLVPGAEYVELHNPSTSQAVSLGGYRISGLDYLFAEGAWLAPGGYAVVTHDVGAFLLEHGNEVPVLGPFPGVLSPSGERLAVWRPGSLPGQEFLVDEVTFGALSPWPETANQGGVSLQLTDPLSDNARPENWGVTDPAKVAHPDWKFVRVTGRASGDRLLVYHSPFQAEIDPLDFKGRWDGAIQAPGETLEMTVVLSQSIGGAWQGDLSIQGGILPLSNVKVSQVTNLTFALDPMYGNVSWQGSLSADGMAITGTFSQTAQGQTYRFPFRLERYREPGVAMGGAVFIDDLRLEVGNQVGAGVNLIRGGDFEVELPAEWVVATNHSQSRVSREQAHAGQGSLHLVASRGGEDAGSALSLAVGPLDAGQTYTLSYWYLPSTNGNDLTVRLESGSLQAQHSVRPGQPATPGLANSAERQVEPSPAEDRLVRINEWQSSNTSTLSEPLRARFEDWVELYNAGARAVDLSGWYLTDDLAEPRKWAFPKGSRIEAGGFLLVWADDHAELNGPTSGFHASFKLSQTGETLGLLDAEGRWVDVVTFGPQAPDISHGRSPDGGSEPWTEFRMPTPGAANPGATEVTRPVISGIRLDGAQILVLSWTAEPGRRYQVKVASEMAGTRWIDASSPLTATEAVMSFRLVMLPGIPMQFYRVVGLR